jgi:WD40 repeat protein
MCVVGRVASAGRRKTPCVEQLLLIGASLLLLADLLLSCSVDKSVGVWDGRSGARVAAWTGHADTVMDVSVACDNSAVSVSWQLATRL